MSSSLDPENFAGNRPQPAMPAGHDLKSLGPSDSSDSGSDMAGPGLINDDAIFLDRGTNEDTEAGHADRFDSGASSGDIGMEDNSDRYGTGEHLTVGKDPDIRMASDIDVDRIVGPDEAGVGRGLDEAEEALKGLSAKEIADIRSGAWEAPDADANSSDDPGDEIDMPEQRNDL